MTVVGPGVRLVDARAGTRTRDNKRMAQAIWTGTISFGLVSVPVRLYPATRRQDVRFHELDRVTGQRIRHQRVRSLEPPMPGASLPASTLPPMRLQEELAETVRRGQGAEPEHPIEREVAYEDVVKGYEVAPRQFVSISRAELEAIAPERSRTIDLEQFVEASAIDPIYFQSSYYALPDRDHRRTFALLLDAMRKTDRYGVGWIVLRRKRRLAVLRPFEGLMLLTTMFHADEVLPQPGLEPAPADLGKKEREMAALLVTTLAGPFEPDRYRDEYRRRVEQLIAGKTPVEPPAGAPAPTAAAGLMAALQASVAQARQRRPAPARPRAAHRPAARRRRKTA